MKIFTALSVFICLFAFEVGINLQANKQGQTVEQYAYTIGVNAATRALR